MRYPILQHIARYLCDTPLKQARKSFAILSLQVSRDMNPVLPFLCFFSQKKRHGKPGKQGFLIPAESLKSLEKQGRTLKQKGNSSQGDKTRNSQKTRKGRTGKKKYRCWASKAMTGERHGAPFLGAVVTRIAATLKSQIASDRNRNSKKITALVALKRCDL